MTASSTPKPSMRAPDQYGLNTMTSDTTHLIIGASLAGAKAAETLRREGFDGPLIMVGAEHEWPYERPPLSKDYLLGKAERETVYVHPQHW